ncbi:Zn-dependent hydrolase, including glyoxylase [Actinokineospora spheciospongiae]|uniref:Zn-dependent hydrolase, including glyoxylase n=1 Tax=Actinokineospora spheciospongiae TaxID=909613 RepID=W7ISS0_9PSEU|nr:MBL fold metallo-hydrolase [Actinokineospora spheciospongiae]EWC59466.1 Zn-dependent hydrolase, including glyoxylase [Actinokineospora spheciospongiae]
MSHPAYGVPRSVTPFASVVLEDNPGPMTLDGTNTWLLRAPGAPGCVVVDPGEEDVPHLERVLAAAGPVEAVLITHHHGDHVGGAEWLARRADAPVRAFDPALCRGSGPLRDGEVLAHAGLSLEVLHTPGHTGDSVCFALEHDGVSAVVTGDTVLGRGTTVIIPPDGKLGEYLDSLRELAGRSGWVLPGHGPELADLAAVAGQYLAHREGRLEQIRVALGVLGAGASAREVVEVVYADVDRGLWPAAELSVMAQLEYLRG